MRERHLVHIQPTSSPNRGRKGIARAEILITVLVIGLLLSILVPAIQRARESSRRLACTNNLRQIQQAVQSYHSSFSCLPSAALWRADELDQLKNLHHTSDFSAVTYQNWLLQLLPNLDQQALAGSIDMTTPIGSPANKSIREAELLVAKCPSDDFHRADNTFQTHSAKFGPIKFMRGNYAINGGTQRFASQPGTSADPVPGGFHYESDVQSRQMAYWGNGVAGFNKSFSFDDFTNGLSTTVAIDEVRAGINPDDSRGVWALGQIGGSVTWAHGMNGDAGRPNNGWKRADDIVGCAKLHERFGEKRLVELGMPCCSYIAHNDQAAARSRHQAGVQVAMLDGVVRFVSNNIDPGLWHVMHSRESPRDVFDDHFEQRLIGHKVSSKESHFRNPDSHDESSDSPESFSNSIGMNFVRIPAGRFIMGLPDEEINAVFEVDGTAKAHWVEISRPFSLGIHEVTQEQFSTVMGRNQSSFADESNSASVAKIDAGRLPVNNVTWHDALEFCRRLSELQPELTAGRRYRLPTEAEWEYACRSGSTDPHLYIPDRQPSDESGENAMKTPPLPIAEVGRFPANEFGLFDMRGNVWEWCADWSHPDYYAQSPTRDPIGPDQGYLKVVRGCDWLFVGQRCMLGFRATEPWLRSPFIGFRVVCEINGKPAGK